MDIKAYIESGILEAYILGALSEEERSTVDAARKQYPELEQELAAIEAALKTYAEKQAPVISDDLQNKIWTKIQNENPISRSLSFSEKQSTAYRSWAIAAGIFLFISLAANGYLLFQNQRYQQQTAARIDTLHSKQQETLQKLAGYKKQLGMMADTAVNTVVMRSMKPEMKMYGLLYWEKQSGDVYISLHGMPAPSQGMQYQLWVIKDGQPVDMGVIPNSLIDSDGMVKMDKSTTAGHAFAISLEKAGGSAIPTMERLYVLGKI